MRGCEWYRGAQLAGPQVGRIPRYRKPGRTPRGQADREPRQASDNVDSVGEGRETRAGVTETQGGLLRPERNLRVDRSTGHRVGSFRNNRRQMRRSEVYRNQRLAAVNVTTAMRIGCSPLLSVQKGIQSAHTDLPPPGNCEWCNDSFRMLLTL